MRDEARLGRMRCHDHETIEEEIAFAYGQGSCGVSSTGVTRTRAPKFMIDISVNNPAAFAVWSNNG